MRSTQLGFRVAGGKMPLVGLIHGSRFVEKDIWFCTGFPANSIHKSSNSFLIPKMRELLKCHFRTRLCIRQTAKQNSSEESSLFLGISRLEKSF